MMDQELFCKRSCNVKEYVFTIKSNIDASLHNTNGYNPLVIKYGFDFPKHTKPFKTIKTEHLIMGDTELIGSLGGTLSILMEHEETNTKLLCGIVRDSLSLQGAVSHTWALITIIFRWVEAGSLQLFRHFNTTDCLLDMS